MTSKEAERAALDEPLGASPGSRGQRISTWIILVCLVGIVVEVGIWTYRKVNPPGFAGVGEQFPMVPATALDGRAAPLMPASADQPATLVLLLTTDCAFCQGNVEHWNEISARAAGAVRIVGLSLHERERTQSFVTAFGVRFPIRVVDDPERLKEAISLPGVPLTLLLDSTGVIRQAWHGPLGPVSRTEIIESASKLAPEVSGSSGSAQRTAHIGEAQR